MKRLLWLLLGAGIVGGSVWLSPSTSHADDEKGDKKGAPIELDGLQSRLPADWKDEEVSETARRMGRLMHYKLPKAKEDKADGDCFVFYFGPGGGGGKDDNIKRYKGMFLPPEDKKIDDVTKVDNLKLGKVDATYVDISGTYLFKKRPIDEKAEPRPDHRMLAVIFETEKGPYYFRLVGPAKTVAQHKKAFDDMLMGFK